ncbi:MAG: alpha-glucosidase/alpha-galactosidase [Clostridia bacterium]|nr:alpha-glucosidase/alpha-galactosidase [Clostridia bacterium]
MIYRDNKAEQIKIAYIGGGSRGWAWALMSDLAVCDDLSGDVYLYDIDYESAKNNEIIGNMFNDIEDTRSKWYYHAVETAKEAYENADFVVISIQPGSFEAMASDVHTPEKYGIYQSVGDTTGPGGIVRSMRTVPMFEEIAECIKTYCPDAWVINYTNPMALCVKTLYRVFPEIKAFGCCHEVFQTQDFLREALKDICGIEVAKRRDIKINPVSVNHFTWLTGARYRNLDLFPIYRKFAEKYVAEGYTKGFDSNWRNSAFATSNRIKLDLFLRYGYIAAAGDRHLAEFCEGKWYLADPETVYEWGFALTPISWRLEDLKDRNERSRRLISGEEKLEIQTSGEDGVDQMRSLLGLDSLLTNANIPNVGQIPNLPLGAIVETNAMFHDGAITPVMAGEVPKEIYSMVSRVCAEQEELDRAIAARDVEGIFNVFANDPLVTCSRKDARELFREMVLNTKEYLGMYDLSNI